MDRETERAFLKDTYLEVLRSNAAATRGLREMRRDLIHRAYKGGLTQREIADALGVTKQHVSHIINGTRS